MEKGEAPGFTLRLRPRANKNLHMPSGYPPGNLLHNIWPKEATPGAMPQAIFRKFRNFLKFSPRRRLRLCPRANKNLHIPAGYPPGNL
ncbi:hypothetical protein T05_3793 [Trichinella murrelli]|uniref:Uncharacterized protein n=1 Tax=Trichinella murrelli TaxID=144512 RepID=A0A0V0T416_9BILA|nr:hypothetical protein T05_3793 [Trichinella murrelli]